MCPKLRGQGLRYLCEYDVDAVGCAGGEEGVRKNAATEAQGGGVTLRRI